MPTPAPQVAAWAVQAPTSSPSSWLRQQELWEHSMAPQNRQRVGCFLSSSVDLGHLRTKYRGDERVEHLRQIFPLKGGDWKDFNCPLTENGWLDWGEHCNPQEDQSNDSFSWGTWRKSLLINYQNRFYYKIKVGQKEYKGQSLPDCLDFAFQGFGYSWVPTPPKVTKTFVKLFASPVNTKRSNTSALPQCLSPTSAAVE